jgi:hypothetical protein
MFSTNQDMIKALITSESAKTRSHVTNLHQSLETKQVNKSRRDRLLQSLWFKELNARKSDIDQPYAGTFQWLFTANELSEAGVFKRWVISEESLFWINGKAGSGKSTLMKFLANDARTLELLNAKLPGCAIYTSFLFNPSFEVLQRSLKGIICTLMHQLLQRNPDIIDELLGQHPELSNRITVFDWDLVELRELLMNCLKLHHSPVCFFIDGLDEIDSRENHFELVALVHEILSRNQNLKICVSSRPEQAFKAGFRDNPSLRLQDLTKDDMRATAEHLLNSYLSTLMITPSVLDLQRLVEELTRKAEGVFLWLRIALKSLISGLNSYEDLAELLRRLKVLPSDLNILYRDMWRRLGDDEALYLQQAAFYFRVALSWDVWNYHALDNPLTTFHMLVARDISIRELVFREKELVVTNEAFTQAMRKINHQMEVQCAGLLEISAPHNSRAPISDEMTLKSVLAQSGILLFNLRFIHRTASDFLLESPDGQELLSHCAFSREAISLSIAKAHFCEALLQRNYRLRGFVVGFSSALSDLRPWNFEMDPHLSKLCRRLSRIHAAGLTWMDEAILDIYGQIQIEFKRRSLTTFLEVLAATADLEVVVHFMGKLESQSGLPAIMGNYLLSRHIISLHWHNYIVATQFDRSHSYCINCDPDPEYSFLTTATLFQQQLPLMMSSFHLLFQRCLKFSYGIENLHSWLDRAGSMNRKTLGICELRDVAEHGMGIHTTIYEGVLQAQAQGRHVRAFPTQLTEIVFEINTAQLINDTIYEALLQANYSASQADWRYMTVDEKACLESRKPQAERCHCRILLVRQGELAISNKSCTNSASSFSDTEKYYEPTEEQSATILNAIPARLFCQSPYDTNLYGYGHGDSTEAVIEKINISIRDVISSNKFITNIEIKDYLRGKGHFIPAQEDVEAYMYGETVEDRAVAMDVLNRKLKQSWENEKEPHWNGLVCNQDSHLWGSQFWFT